MSPECNRAPPRVRPAISVALVLLLTSAASSPAAEPTGFRAQQCRVAVLSQLGWRVHHAEVTEAVAHGGLPCIRRDLAAAHAAGDLMLTLPSDTRSWLLSTAGRQQLDAVFDSSAMACAYSIRLGEATRNASDRLIANERFQFSALQRGWIGFGDGSAADAGWRQTASWGRAFVPSDSPSTAVQSFYRRPIRAECGVGRQITQYAMLAELFGPQAFNIAFGNDEIVIGTFLELGRSRSVLLGSSRGRMFADGRAVKTSALGRQAFNGVPGFLFHVFDADTLSDINNQAQNFVVYEVDSAAAASLRTHAGFEHFNRINRQLWELSQPFQVRGRRWFQRMLSEQDSALIARLTRRERALHLQMRTLLDDPFYRGFRVYGHPHGVQSIGWLVVRMLDRNPRTPFRVELALHNLHTEIMDRDVQGRIAACESGR